MVGGRTNGNCGTNFTKNGSSDKLFQVHIILDFPPVKQEYSKMICIRTKNFMYFLMYEQRISHAFHFMWRLLRVRFLYDRSSKSYYRSTILYIKDFSNFTQSLQSTIHTFHRQFSIFFLAIAQLHIYCDCPYMLIIFITDDFYSKVLQTVCLRDSRNRFLITLNILKPEVIVLNSNSVEIHLLSYSQVFSCGIIQQKKYVQLHSGAHLIQILYQLLVSD